MKNETNPTSSPAMLTHKPMYTIVPLTAVRPMSGNCPASTAKPQPPSARAFGGDRTATKAMPVPEVLGRRAGDARRLHVHHSGNGMQDSLRLTGPVEKEAQLFRSEHWSISCSFG